MTNIAAWRAALTDDETRAWQRAYRHGSTSWQALHGHREYDRRRATSSRRRQDSRPRPQPKPPLPHHEPCAACSRAVVIKARGLCQACWKRAKRDGTLDQWPRTRVALTPPKITPALPLTRRQELLEDADELWGWGEIPENIAKRVGRSKTSLEDYYRRAGRRAPWLDSEAVSA
jgi:hypothetical protein